MMLLYVILSIPVLLYLVMPLVFVQTLRIHARPPLQQITPTYFPDEVKEYFESVSPKLSAMGFAQEAAFLIEDSMPNTTAHVSLWINRKTGQAGAANVLITKRGDKPPVVRTYVEFLTRFASGASITTNNCAVLGAFKPTRDADTLNASRLTNPDELYRLHLWRESHLAKPGMDRFLPAPDAATQWYAAGYEESIARQVGTGYLRQIAGEEAVYQPTVTGAYAMTWAQLPPMKNMRRSAEDRRADAQIRKALASAVTAPNGVRITYEREGKPTGPAARKAA